MQRRRREQQESILLIIKDYYYYYYCISLLVYDWLQLNCTASEVPATRPCMRGCLQATRQGTATGIHSLSGPSIGQAWVTRHGWPGMAGQAAVGSRQAAGRQQAGSRQAADRQQGGSSRHVGLRQEADTLAMTRDVSVSFGRVSRSHPPPRTRLTDSRQRKRSTSRSPALRRQNGG